MWAILIAALRDSACRRCLGEGGEEVPGGGKWWGRMEWRCGWGWGCGCQYTETKGSELAGSAALSLWDQVEGAAENVATMSRKSQNGFRRQMISKISDQTTCLK